MRRVPVAVCLLSFSIFGAACASDPITPLGRAGASDRDDESSSGEGRSSATVGNGSSRARGDAGATTDNTPSTTSNVPFELETLPAPSEFPGSFVFHGKGSGPHPGIVMLHGSEGGTEGLTYAAGDGEVFAKAGFTVMFVCWFGCPGRPERVLRVPLETVTSAVAWLKQSAHVGGKKVGLFGISRGAEMSVLIASLVRTTDSISAVGVHAASDTVVSSYDPQTEDGVYERSSTGQYVYAPAWTWAGLDRPGETTGYETTGPAIAVEDYSGPLYLSHGEADEVWPVARSKNLEARRRNGTAPTSAHYWPGEKHVLSESAFTTMFGELQAFFTQHLGT